MKHKSIASQQAAYLAQSCQRRRQLPVSSQQVCRSVAVRLLAPAPPGPLRALVLYEAAAPLLLTPAELVLPCVAQRVDPVRGQLRQLAQQRARQADEQQDVGLQGGRAMV